jgi:hypothetical protein
MSPVSGALKPKLQFLRLDTDEQVACEQNDQQLHVVEDLEMRVVKMRNSCKLFLSNFAVGEVSCFIGFN